MLEFHQKVICITGAASGIGRATAIKLASLGAILALGDINPKTLHETKELCENTVEHTLHTLDVSSTLGCEQFISQVIAHHGQLHHLFNCAGVNPTAYNLVDTTDSYWDKIVNTNLRGTYAVTRTAIPHLSKTAAQAQAQAPGSVSITNVSSILGTKGASQMAIYSASKWAIIGFTKSLALELGPKGIRVNAVAPGYIETATNSDVVEGPDAVRKSAEKVALRRMGSAEEVAEVVSWLMGEGARYVNGSVVEVNGGLA